MPRKLHLAISSSNYSKSKIRKNLEKCQKGKNHPQFEETEQMSGCDMAEMLELS